MPLHSLLDPWLALLREQPLLAWAWIVMVGACIGSFLNVVVYRLPEGMSLSHPGSRCPACGHAIRWHDNVPVLGWVLLRGRCRDCGQGISSRYPLVELLVALLFGWLWYLDVASVIGTQTDGPHSLGASLHAAVSASSDVPDNGTMAFAAGLLRFAGHVLWLVPLLATALIEGDGKRVPRSLWIFAGVAALALPVVAACVLPEEASRGLWRGMGGGDRGGVASRAAVRLVAGGAVGLAVWMLVRLRAARQGEWSRRGTTPHAGQEPRLKQGATFANGRLPDAMIVGGLTGLHCGANVVPVLLLAHLLVLLGHRPAAGSSPGGSTPGASQAESAKRGHRSGPGGRKAANSAVAASPRFRFGWLAAVLLLTLFWLD